MAFIENHIYLKNFSIGRVCRIAPFFCFYLLLLTSCETQSDFGSGGNGLSSQTTVSRAGEDALTLPPGMSAGDDSPRNKLIGMKGLKGVNVDQLFSQNIRDTDKRFDRLESVVLDFRREYESVKPEIIRLVAIEKDMQQLISLLNNEVGLPPASPEFANLNNDPIENAPVPDVQEQNMITNENIDIAEAPSPPPPPTPPPSPPVVTPQLTTPQPPTVITPPATTNGKVTINNFRFGAHPDYVRLVIDATQKTPYSIDLDSSGEILTILLPSSSWSGSETKSYGGSSDLIDSYRAQEDPQSNGTIVYVSFKKPVTLKNQGTLASDSAPKFRIYIDVK